ncbi:transposase [Streptomyces sp. NPDC002454]
MLDAVRYLVDNGIKWHAIPADFPPWDRVHAFFHRWRDHVLGLVRPIMFGAKWSGLRRSLSRGRRSRVCRSGWVRREAPWNRVR